MEPTRKLLAATVTAACALSLTATQAVADTAAEGLLTDPFLQLPTQRGVNVVWMTESDATQNVVLVGDVADLTTAEVTTLARGGEVRRHPQGKSGRGPKVKVDVFAATSSALSRTAEDAQSVLPEGEKPTAEQGIVDRTIHRHEAAVTGLHPHQRSDYRVASFSDGKWLVSETFTLRAAPRKNEDLTILLTSDHQQMRNTVPNLTMAADTLEEIDAVFVAGDLVNIPDRASEWFDHANGLAFFQGMQGNSFFTHTNGRTYAGGEILQHAPVYPAIGNHEVQGRRDGATSLNASFNNPVPEDVAEAVYADRESEVNPAQNPSVRQTWLEDNSWSTRTYEEIFSLPDSAPEGEKYYSATVGNVRLISLFSTRIWRGTTATPDPEARTQISRYHESAAVLDDPLRQGHGSFIFSDLTVDSTQYQWLEQELSSRETQAAEHVVVMLHEGPNGLGDNVMPHFTQPERIEEFDDSGTLTGIRYEYPAGDNQLLTAVTPLLERSGVDLVFNGHNHLWNRFESPTGTNYLETSNVGNNYGAYHPLSGRSRPVPPAPWDPSNYLAQGNPGGLEPIVPTVAPFTTSDGTPQPFFQTNDYSIFSAIDTGEGTVTSWMFDVNDPDRAPWIVDQFNLN